MFEYSYTQDQDKTKLKVIYTNYYENSKNGIRETVIESDNIDHIKSKFTGMLIDFMGGTLDSYVLRYQLEYQRQKQIGTNAIHWLDVHQYSINLKRVYKHFYNLNSPYKRAVYVLSIINYLKQSNQHTLEDINPILTNHIKDLHKVSNKLINILHPLPKTEQHARNKMSYV